MCYKAAVTRIFVGMQRTKVKKMKRKTVTFEPDPALAPLLEEADKRGRGKRSLVINRTLVRYMAEQLAEWDAFDKRGLPVG